MRIEQKPDAIVIETTDIHLPHAIGKRPVANLLLALAAVA